METSSLSQIQKTTSLQNTKATSSHRALEQNDAVSLSTGAREAQKIATWVEMLKTMPETLPPHFEKERGHGEIVKVIADRLMEEVGTFLTDHP